MKEANDKVAASAPSKWRNSGANCVTSINRGRDSVTDVQRETIARWSHVDFDRIAVDGKRTQLGFRSAVLPAGGAAHLRNQQLLR